MLGGNAPDQKVNFRDKEACWTKPDIQANSDVHAKIAEKNHSEKPREAVDPSTNTKFNWTKSISYLVILKSKQKTVFSFYEPSRKFSLDDILVLSFVFIDLFN